LLRRARIFATAGSEQKQQICRDLGAEIALDYRSDLVQPPRSATDDADVDVILDVQASPIPIAN
jgi:NADPH:quinone reductase